MTQLTPEQQDEANRLLLTALIDAVRAVNEGLKQQAVAINNQAAAINHLADAIASTLDQDEPEEPLTGLNNNKKGRIIPQGQA